MPVSTLPFLMAETTIFCLITHSVRRAIFSPSESRRSSTQQLNKDQPGANEWNI